MQAQQGSMMEFQKLILILSQLKKDISTGYMLTSIFLIVRIWISMHINSSLKSRNVVWMWH